MERCGVLPTTKSAYRKGRGTCDTPLYWVPAIRHTLQSALESVQEVWIVQIDFSVSFVVVNHQLILCKLCSVIVCSCCVYVHSLDQIDHKLRWTVVE